MMSSELCVPAAALAESGEDGAKVAPEQGDHVEVSIGGTVTRIEGDSVYFKAETANGEPITEHEASAKDTGLDDEGEQLNKSLHGYGGKTMIALLLLFLGCFGMEAAELRLSDNVSISATPTTNVVFLNAVTGVFTNAMRVYKVEIPNLSAAAGFGLLFDSSTNHLVNDSNFVWAPKPVAVGANCIFDFSPEGLRLTRGLNACLSTTPSSLTNAAAGSFISVTWSPDNR